MSGANPMIVLFPKTEAGLIAELIQRDTPFYDPSISMQTVDALNNFARNIGILSGPASYDQVVATQFRDLFEHFLPRSRLVAAGFLRPDSIRRMVHDHGNRRTDHGNRLWLLLNAEIWYRMHIEHTSVDALTAEVAEACRGSEAARAAQPLPVPVTADVVW